RIMGVINVTPDSFSDGGDRLDPGRAVADGLALREAGAEILDVGGESTRPGSEPIEPEEELNRVIPVIRGLAREGALISIDTRRARVMAEALDAGARIVNDVTALSGDPESLPLVARAVAPLVLMHMRGEPRTMQADPVYDDAPRDIYDWLAARIAACEAAGIPRARIAIDPGIGFGKTVEHNLQILARLALFHGLGCVVLLGVSRKSFIGRLSQGEPPKERVPGSLAAALAGLARGVQILRVHDVAETRQALSIWQAISEASDPAAESGAAMA
ncbi:MAG TPA: dihydropteroate synthase, partial [Kiloniellales bacterium]|nr:dihydropteroate synthase [Kiloniellales bacterium]